jgi:uncharacterized protein (DUF885 family)
MSTQEGRSTNAGPIDAGRTDARPLDASFTSLAERFFHQLMEHEPVWATFIGLHRWDDRLGNTSREGVEQKIGLVRTFLRDVEALPENELSPDTRFERELATQAARRFLFNDEVHCVWDRRGTATDEVGDGLFGLLARDFAPLTERLASMTSRLEHAPRVIDENRQRLGDRPVRVWNELELQSAGEIGTLFDSITAAGRETWGGDSREQRRLEQAADRARAAFGEYGNWLQDVIDRSNDDFALGRERYEQLVALRAFDGLATDDILAIGEEQLAANKRDRSEVARQIDPNATEQEVLDRVKSSHPATFDEALVEYRNAMVAARTYIRDERIATLPEGEQLSVIATPEYLRNVMPFAAYFEPPKFDPNPSGIYVVTPSVDGDPRAMREHNYSSIRNTSIHEAYPGHHQQLSAAITHPSLVRMLVDAPEFVEGWAMYCEQMMREEGFDTAPESLLMMYTDAIWRACRIILDIRLHRGEIGVDGAVDFLVQQTGFERPNAEAEVRRYTYTPTYQLSYLLGKVLLLRLRDDEKRRLGAQFSLRRFHDSLLYAGSLPISFQRRAMAGEGAETPIPVAAR